MGPEIHGGELYTIEFPISRPKGMVRQSRIWVGVAHARVRVAFVPVRGGGCG